MKTLHMLTSRHMLNRQIAFGAQSKDRYLYIDLFACLLIEQEHALHLVQYLRIQLERAGVVSAIFQTQSVPFLEAAIAEISVFAFGVEAFYFVGGLVFVDDRGLASWALFGIVLYPVFIELGGKILILHSSQDSQLFTISIVPLLITTLMRAYDLPFLGLDHTVKQRHNRGSSHHMSTRHLHYSLLQTNLILQFPKIFNLGDILRRYFFLHDHIIQREKLIQVIVITDDGIFNPQNHLLWLEKMTYPIVDELFELQTVDGCINVGSEGLTALKDYQSF